MLIFSTFTVKTKDVESGSDSSEKLRAGTAVFLIDLEKRRSIKACHYISMKSCVDQPCILHIFVRNQSIVP
jgi:hypothetical protein